MRVILQRVTRAAVRVEGRTVGTIGSGYVALIGVERGDGCAEVESVARKIIGLRLWADAAGKMNEALGERSVLAVPQFTLLGDTRRGMRPSFERAAAPAQAEKIYDTLVAHLREAGVRVETGVFRTHMEVELVNDGPVTVTIESRAQR